MEQTHAAAARPATRTLGWLLLIPVIAAGLFGGNVFGVRDRAFPAPTNLSNATINNAAHQATSGENALPAEPYWVSVSTFSGSDNATKHITIASDALQWQVVVKRCEGSISIDAQRSGSAPQSIAHNAACSGSYAGFGVESGAFTLRIAATGSWTLDVQQELDRPQNSPPLAAMSAPGSALLSSGTFYGIDQQGQGTARIYRLPDGTSALRLDNFYVTPNTDFLIRLSPLPHPASTPEFMSTPSAIIAPLPVTAGSFNFAIPPGIDPTAYHSVVIWCDRLISAYAGATLQPA